MTDRRGQAASVRSRPGGPEPQLLTIQGLPRRRRLRAIPHDVAGRIVSRIASISYGALFGVWIGVVVFCGLVYWAAPMVLGPALREGNVLLGPSLHDLWTAQYFSFVTATSVGFGDVVPLGPIRILAILESAAGLLIFGGVISKLVSHRQEQLLEETHLLAFEERLGRVRTNLHLVLSELQGMAMENAAGRVSPLRSMPRLESAAMIFVGELRAVHDLLYRPQQAPEPAILEAILATLAACERELSDLLDAEPGMRSRSTLLTSNLASVRRLAGEICGECVPRQYAPELKVWMDQIQELSHKISAD